MLRKNFNDSVALVLFVLIPVLWILGGRGWVSLGAQVEGGLLVTWTMVIQYYFRQRPPDPPSGTNGGRSGGP